jgi:hypothetical protein
MLFGLARQLGFRRRSMRTRQTAWLCVPALGAALACSPGPGSALGRNSQAFVNGDDDRREFFELPEGVERAAFEQSAVVLMSAGAADLVASGDAALLNTWGEVNNLCPDQPFVDQPSAAFCSGVLLDWNLVLTSGHCVDAVPLESLRVAFGFYYSAAGELALRDDDVYAVAQVVTSRRDPGSPEGNAERLDYAWLELERDVSVSRRPAAAYVRGPRAAEGAPVISIGAGGGVPLKWDDGGHVQRTRPGFDDYFIADTDTSQGSSGGAIFDENLALLGSLARGAADFSLSDAGCYVTATESDPAAALEQFTYVHRAVQGLCAEGSDSALCDPACDEPCDVSLFGGPESDEESGCALAPAQAEGRSGPLLALLGAALLCLRRRPRVSAGVLPVEHRAVTAARHG